MFLARSPQAAAVRLATASDDLQDVMRSWW